MDKQEILNQIRELQKQRTSLKEQDDRLILQIGELRDKLKLDSISNGYYTDGNGLFCRVCDIKSDVIFIYELDTIEPPCITKETYFSETFKETYCKECTKEEYDKALDKIVERYKD